MTAPPDDTTADTSAIIAALRTERDGALAREAALAEALATRNSEYGERIAHQAATVDVLKVMSASPGDPQPVFELIVRRAAELCGGSASRLMEFDGDLVHASASFGILADANARYLAMFPRPPFRESISCRAILEKRVIHVRDLDTDPDVLDVIRAGDRRCQRLSGAERWGRSGGGASGKPAQDAGT